MLWVPGKLSGMGMMWPACARPPAPTLAFCFYSRGQRRQGSLQYREGACVVCKME